MNTMTTIGRRLARLEHGRGRRWSPASRRFVSGVAAIEGVAAAELIAETDRFLDRAERAGATVSVEALCRYHATETGEDPDRVQADMAAGLAAWKTRLAADAGPHDEHNGGPSA